MTEQERIPVGRVRGLVIANIAAVCGAFVFAAVTAARLPARYPSHFDAAGQPDRWSSAGGAEWYVMPIFGAILAAVLMALALLLPRIPIGLVNVPRKEQFLRLTPAQRAPIIQYLIRFLLWISLLDTVFFVAIHWTLYRSVVRGHAQHGWVMIVAASAAYLLYIIWGTVRIYRLVRRATERLPAEGVHVGPPR